MKHPVLHFEIVDKDAKTLFDFYSGLFEWDIKDAGMPDGSYGLVLAEEGQIGGGIGATDQAEGHVTFYVGVDDVEAALAKAESLGGKRLMGPEKPAPGTIIGLFADPEGHMVGVVSGDGD
jgi:predicted enzyme related to lactoylglutathione lyase